MSVNRSVFYTLLTQIPLLLSGIGCSIFITRTIGAGGQGVYSLGMTAIELFTFMLGFNLNTALVVYSANRKIPEARLIGMGSMLLAAGFVLLTVFLLSLYLFTDHPFLFPEKTNGLFYFFFLTAGFALNVFHATMIGLFQGRKLFRIVNQLQILLAVVNIMGYGLAFYLHYIGFIRVTVINLFFFYLCSMCGMALLWLAMYVKHVRVRPSFQFDFAADVRPFLLFLLNGHLGQVVNIIIYRADMWIVDYYLPKTDVGYYARAVGVAQLLLMIPNTITAILNPYLADPNHRDREALTAFYSRLHFTLVCILSLGGIALAPFVFPWVYGADFSASVIPFMIMLPAVLFVGMTRIFGTFNISRNRLRENLYASLAALLFIIPLDLLLIPRMGIAGAALASVLAYFLLMAGTFYFARTASGLPRANYLLLSVAEMRDVLKRVMQLTGR